MKKLFFALAAGLLLTSGLSGCAPATNSATEWPEKLVFAAVPQDPTVETQETYQLLIDLLEKELGIPVEFYKTTEAAPIIEGLAADRVDLAWFGPYSYVLAKQRTPDLAVIGMQVRGADAVPGIYMLAVAKAENSAINELVDVKGKTVCFGDPAGSGFLYSAKGLAEVGIDPKTETTTDIEPVVLGSVNTGIAVAAGDCDAGFMADTTLKQQYSDGTIKDGALKVVWQSELTPAAPMVIRTKLPKDLQEKITDLILNHANKTAFVNSGVCTDEASCKFLTSINWGYVASDEKFVDEIREACLVLGNKECK